MHRDRKTCMAVHFCGDANYPNNNMQLPSIITPLRKNIPANDGQITRIFLLLRPLKLRSTPHT